MKLLTVLLLVALPLYCSAGSGCQILEDTIVELLDRNVSTSDIKSGLAEFLVGSNSSEAIDEFRQCFLNQSDETLKNIGLMMQIIYNSPWCALF
ncbi:mammaglobin-A [Lemur catta]|uniref:mammaglobin-A n=1 Tax=Lemur catta TaxID=9447 RepID=UPI001E269B8A|nr:mammaglobin-A [Lemur catta]